MPSPNVATEQQKADAEGKERVERIQRRSAAARPVYAGHGALQ